MVKIDARSQGDRVSLSVKGDITGFVVVALIVSAILWSLDFSWNVVLAPIWVPIVTSIVATVWWFTIGHKSKK